MRCLTSDAIIRSAVAVLFAALVWPRPAGAQGRCQLLVISRPAGATVSVGGEERGKAPLTVAGLKVGREDVKVVLEGYYVWTKRIQLRPGGNTVEAKLEKKKASPPVSPAAPKGGDEEAPAGGGDAEAPAGKTAVDEAPAGESGGKPPRMIPVPCPCCKGKGVIDEMGCPTCEVDGYAGRIACRACNKTGRVRYDCPLCEGKGTVRKGTEDVECRLCSGKGHPPCLACKAKGTVMRPNPEAVDYATTACMLCTGTGIDEDNECHSCNREGRMYVSAGGYYTYITCYICGGDNRGPKLCRQCRGLGYRGQGKKGLRPSPCIACYGKGHLFLPCKRCRGVGWHKAR